MFQQPNDDDDSSSRARRTGSGGAAGGGGSSSRRQGYSTRPSTSQLLARADQTSDDELLARVLAIEEDEKYARKLQSDLAAGIEPQIRPFSAMRSAIPTKSESNLLSNNDTNLPNSNELGSSRNRIRNQLYNSREHVSHDELPLDVAANLRESVIDRSGALHDLTADEKVADKDSASYRASALKGGLVTDSNLSTNLASNASLGPTKEMASSASYSGQRSKDNDHADEDDEDDDDDGFPQPSGLATKNSRNTTSSPPTQQLAQQSNPQPPRRTHRPESARRSVPRHSLLQKDDSEEEDNLDMYMQQVESAEISGASHSPIIKSQQQRPESSRPQLFDSLPKNQNSSEDSTHQTSEIIFPEATQPAGVSHAESWSTSSEYTELFAFIGTYQPQECELPQKLQCFLPEYMPCIGDIDPMIKVVPPSRFPDTNTAVYPATLPNLGITILDEPSASQSDPAVLDLHIRALHKSQMVTPHLSPTKIRSIPLSATSSEATRATHQKALNQWISNMTNLHQHKLPDSVHYVKAMPDIETLMEQWPEEVERAFQSGEVDIPPAEIDLTLAEYGQLICNMIDIPVYFSKDKKKKPEDRHFIESIHVFLTLYLEFKNSQHFGHRQRVEVAPDTS